MREYRKGPAFGGVLVLEATILVSLLEGCIFLDEGHTTVVSFVGID